jgi:hypothetical protein
VNANIFDDAASLYSGTSSATSSAGAYSNSTGTVSLDDQEFQFGNAFLDKYLVSVSVTDPNAANLSSRTALSAMTVDFYSAPEPSTIALLAVGGGLIGLKRFRRA